MGLEGAVKLGFRNELAGDRGPGRAQGAVRARWSRACTSTARRVNMASHFEIDDVIDCDRHCACRASSGDVCRAVPAARVGEGGNHDRQWRAPQRGRRCSDHRRRVRRAVRAPQLRNEMGLSAARVFEAGGGVGGTWYWNRYPGARSDSDSYIYGFTFDEELWREWQWSERYPEQHEVRAYLEHVAERYDLNRDITFNTRVESATFDESTEPVDRRDRRRRDGRPRSYVITAVGALSASHTPSLPGRRHVPRARATTPGNGRTRRSTSPVSVLASSAPAPVPCRPSR